MKNKTVIITSGIHGDEKSGILSAVLLSKLKFKNIDIKLFPILNKTGNLISSRESIKGNDLNRNFTQTNQELKLYFDEIKKLSNVKININLHEDDLSNGAYLYCCNNSLNNKISTNLITYLKSKNVNIANHHLIDNRYKINNGVVSVNSPPYKGIQDFYFQQKYFNCPSFSLEIPKNLPMKNRIYLNLLSILYLINSI